MELHLRVPADHWCVTFKEFFQFVEDVRTAWLEGEILQRDTWRAFVRANIVLACSGSSISQRMHVFFQPC